MEDNLDQRVCIKFCLANGFSCADSLKMLRKAFGTACMSKTQTYEWYKSFKEGREEIIDLPRSGRPLTSTTDENTRKVKELVLNNRHMSIRELAIELKICRTSVHGILSDMLGMKRVAGRLVSKDLNFLQKQHRKEIADDMVCRTATDATFLKRIVTGGETWFYDYDVPSDREWHDANERRSKKARQSGSKVMLAVFFDYRGLVHAEFLPEGQSMNKHYYLATMKRLRECMRVKRSELWANNSWILHHDNTPAHNATIVREYLAENLTNVIDQPPFSPDLVPCDFFLFPKLKLQLRGRHFTTIEAMKQHVRNDLSAIPTTAYGKCLSDWVKRWHSCVADDGAYFEADKINFDD